MLLLPSDRNNGLVMEKNATVVSRFREAPRSSKTVRHTACCLDLPSVVGTEPWLVQRGNKTVAPPKGSLSAGMVVFTYSTKEFRFGWQLKQMCRNLNPFHCHPDKSRHHRTNPVLSPLIPWPAYTVITPNDNEQISRTGWNCQYYCIYYLLFLLLLCKGELWLKEKYHNSIRSPF